MKGARLTSSRNLTALMWEIKALRTTLRARQQHCSSYSVDVWAEMQWLAVAPDEALVLRIVVLSRTKKRKMRE